MSDRDYAAEMAMLTKYGVSIDIEPMTGEWGAFLPNCAPLCESGVFSRDPYERGASFPDFHSAFAAAVEACKRLEEPFVSALLAEVRAARRVVEAVEGMLHQEVTGDPIGRSRARTKLDRALAAFDAATGGAT